MNDGLNVVLAPVVLTLQLAACSVLMCVPKREAAISAPTICLLSIEYPTRLLLFACKPHAGRILGVLMDYLFTCKHLLGAHHWARVPRAPLRGVSSF
jgi:hypothetical protein